MSNQCALQSKKEVAIQNVVPRLPTEQSTIEEYKEGLFAGAGGTPVVEERPEEPDRKVLREDPIKLVQETIRKQFPEAPFADKAFFTLHVLHSRLNKVIKALPDMSKNERAYWVSKLEKEYHSLERQFEKLSIKGMSQSIGERFQYLRTAIKEIEASNLSAQKARQKKLDRIEQGQYGLKVAPKLSANIVNSTTKVERLSDADFQEVKKVEAACSEIFLGKSERIGALTTSLETLTKRIDQLIDNKHYDLAMTLSRLILALIPDPPPTLKAEGFWTTLEDISGTDTAIRERSNQIRSISAQLGKISKYLWESKLKTLNLKMQSDEWVGMLSIDTALHQLMLNRKHVLDILKGNHPSTPETEIFTFEEHCFYDIASNYAYPETYITTTLKKLVDEIYLRPSENPLLSIKLKNLFTYMNLLNQRGHMGTDGQQLVHCDQVLKVAKLRNIKGCDMKYDKLWESYFHQTGPIAVPSQILDLSRHQMVHNSLATPDTSVTRHWSPTKGALALIGTAIKAALKSENLYRRLFLNAVKDLGDNRVEIYTFTNRTLLGDIRTFCVLPRGSAPGTYPKVAIREIQSNFNFKRLLQNSNTMISRVFLRQCSRGVEVFGSVGMPFRWSYWPIRPRNGISNGTKKARKAWCFSFARASQIRR